MALMKESPVWKTRTASIRSESVRMHLAVCSMGLGKAYREFWGRRPSRTGSGSDGLFDAFKRGKAEPSCDRTREE